MSTFYKSAKTVFIFTILFITTASFAQSGWVVQNSGTTGNLTRVYFMDENTGYASIPSLRTTNGGVNWVLNPGLIGFYDLSFVNQSTGFAVFDSIFKSTNGGINWINLGNRRRYQVEFVDENLGFAAGNNYMGITFLQVILKTTNGGATWDSILIGSGFAYQDYFSSLTMYNSQIGYAGRHVEPDVGNLYGLIYKTSNGFNSWGTIFYREYMKDILSICMPTLDTIYFIGDYSFPSPPKWFIYRGINDNWSIMDTSLVQLTDLFFTSALTGYATGYGGLILKTTNGGLNWYTQNSGTVAHLQKIFFTSEVTGYIVGNGGVILKTITAGEPLSVHSISGTVRYEDNNQPVSSGYVKALKFNQVSGIITTVDSAQIQSNGTYLLPNVPEDTLDIMAFQDDEEQTNFVPTYHISTIYWENAVHVFPDTNLTNIDIGVFRINRIVDNKHIGGSVYNTIIKDLAALKDAFVYARIGNVFKGYSITGNPGTYCIDSLSSGSYEIICNRMGYYSAIRPFELTTFSVDTLDFILSYFVVSIEPNWQNVPEKYCLSQNYPNPFNPQTKIKFGLPVQCNVKLVLFDVLGREIGILVNNELKAGEYDVTWDATSLSSGVYFYRLEAGDYVETRKMVLLR